MLPLVGVIVGLIELGVVEHAGHLAVAMVIEDWHHDAGDQQDP